jgi:glucose/arabinose dehydrogenase
LSIVTAYKRWSSTQLMIVRFDGPENRIDACHLLPKICCYRRSLQWIEDLYVFFFAIFFYSVISAAAHAPEGAVYKVYQFADDNVPQMDGDTSDWDQVPIEYFFDLHDHTEVKEGKGIEHNTADLHIKRVAVGWNERLNRLYFMAEVADNIHLFEKPAAHIDSLKNNGTGAFVHGSDIFEIVIDADHGGERVVNLSDDEAEEMRLRSAFAQNYHLYMPPLNNGSFWNWMWGWATWTDDPAYSDVGWRFEGEHGSDGTVIYECYLTPFDDLDPAGPESSIVHDLTEGAIIGLSWAFLDADAGTAQQRAFWSLSGERQMAANAAFLSDFELMPVGARTGDPAESPPGTFSLTPQVDLDLQPVPLVVPEKFRGLVPDGLTMNLPPGFSAKVFAATGLEGPRLMDFSPAGVLHVANMKVGGASVFKPPAGAGKSQIVALPDEDGDGVADRVVVAVDGLSWANSLVFDSQGALYVADSHELLRFGDGDGDGVYEQRELLAEIPGWHEDPTDVQHITRTIVIDEKNSKIYVSIGSSCDICRETEDERAVVLQFDMDGAGRRIFASGIRNAIGLDLHPVTNELWAVNNGHGREGWLLPPEWIDIVRDGGFYGWPLAYPHQVYVDFSIAQYAAMLPVSLEDSSKVERMRRPVAQIPAHLAPMDLHFYTGDAFPARFREAAFFALRAGRRAPSPGYKVMALFSEPDGSNARVADFLTGFEPDPLDRGNVWGYPVGIAEDAQGNLYVSSDWDSHAIIKVVPGRIDARLEGTLPETVFSGRPLEIDAVVQVDARAEGEAPVVTADLSGFGGSADLPLPAIGDNRYRLQVSLPPLEPGSRVLVIRVEQQTPLDRLATIVQHRILVAPGADLVIAGDRLGPAWTLGLDGGLETAARENSAALSFQADKDQSSSWLGWRVSLEPEGPLDINGYSVLRFAFHRGDVEIGDRDRFSVAVQPGKNINLFGEGLVDKSVAGWQAVEIPLELFELAEPVERIRFLGTLKGTFHFNDLRIRTAAAVPETAVLEERTAAVPGDFALQQNRPNPFNSDTVIRFALPTHGEVELHVYNLTGQRVATLVEGAREAGTYAVRWDGRNASGQPLASGVYLYRLRSGERVESRKLLLLK